MTMKPTAALATNLEKIVDLYAIKHPTTKFSHPFKTDGNPSKFWRICCFVADRKSARITDINRHFYKKSTSDWHSLIPNLCDAGLLMKCGDSYRPGYKLEAYRRIVVSVINM